MRQEDLRSTRLCILDATIIGETKAVATCVTVLSVVIYP